MNAKEKFVLELILKNTTVYFHNGQFNAYSNYTARNGRVKEVQSLKKAGLVTGNYYLDLTPAGYAALNTSVFQLYRELMVWKINFLVSEKTRITGRDKPSNSPETVEYYSSERMYNRPMTAAEVYALECERVHENRVQYEHDIQEAERQMAEVEVRYRGQ